MDTRSRRRYGASGRGNRWARACAVVTTTMAVVASTVLTAGQASASLSSAGPIDPATNFPAYFTDGNGLSLDLCLGLPNCLADTDLVAIHEAGGDAEAFYYAADASTASFTVHLALEAAYAGDGPDQEVVFQRTQLTARAGGLVPGGVYRVTDPYGTYSCTADSTGTIRQNACRIETTPVAGEFARALGGRIGPFLTVDPSEPAPPAGFIGDNVTPRKVIGSPTGFNAFRVEGPGLTSTCTASDGSQISNCEQTDEFILQGRIADTGVPSASVSHGTLDFGDVPASPVTKTLTYANTGTQPVSVGSLSITGPNASAFTQTSTCPTAPETLAGGARCTIDVTFTPEPGARSVATLTITDDTPAAVRNIALRGSNLGVMYVSDPVPPAGISFGTVGVGVTSPEDNVVLGNRGNGPLTITAVTLTGPSAAHYKLGPNNTCTGPGVIVDPGGGCEIGVQFKPTSSGSKSASLRVTDSTGAVVNVPLSGTGVADSTPPTTPALSGSRVGTTANLSWTAATDAVGVAGYRVFRGGSQLGADLPATARSFSDAGLAPGTYSYTVRAFDAAGNVSVDSNVVTVTVPVPDTTAPTAPTLSGSVTGTTANLSWTAATDAVGVTGYRIFRGASQVGTTTATTRTFSQANLAAGTYAYTVRAVDAAGNVSAASNAVSLTVAAANPAPTVTTRSPAAGSTAVAVSSNITATFSEPVVGVGAATFQVRNPAGTVVAGAITQSTTVANQWILNPTANLSADTRYTVTLTGGAGAIRDTAGAPLATSSWTFTTGPAPRVTARTPGVGAVRVSRTANVTATFSEAVQPASVSGTTFTLRNPAGSQISAVVTYNTTSRVATLNPSVTLAPNTTYRVNLVGGTTGVRDLAGNPLANVTWTFTTGP